MACRIRHLDYGHPNVTGHTPSKTYTFVSTLHKIFYKNKESRMGPCVFCCYFLVGGSGGIGFPIRILSSMRVFFKSFIVAVES